MMGFGLDKGWRGGTWDYLIFGIGVLRQGYGVDLESLSWVDWC